MVTLKITVSVNLKPPYTINSMDRRNTEGLTTPHIEMNESPIMLKGLSSEN
jgi:hypothetical protein